MTDETVAAIAVVATPVMPAGLPVLTALLGLTVLLLPQRILSGGGPSADDRGESC